MRRTRAEGRCQGKTGTLEGASNLVGYCRAANGHTLAFAIFTDAISVESAHVFQDHIAISLASSNLSDGGTRACRCPPLSVEASHDGGRRALVHD